MRYNERMKPLYEDDEILICEKSAGMATESANIREKDLVSAVRNYLGGNYVGLVHRLDQPVSGLLVFAKTPEAAAKLSRQVQTSDMGKSYLATVEGKLDAAASPVILSDYLIKDAKKKMALVVEEHTKDANGKEAKQARLSYEVLSYDPLTDTTELKIDLLTGRFHQIRAQLSHLGHPILRDVKYGAKKPADPEGSAGIALCAYSLSFHHPKTGEEMHFQIPNRSL